ncbi:ABC transporter substrate-binding protein [Homoserinimonas sp. A447]
MHSRIPIRSMAVVAAVATTLALASCAPPGAENEEEDTGTAGAVKVGLIASETGFAAAFGADMKRGWDLYWEQHDNTSGEFTIESIYEDDASDAETALNKATRLVEEVNVDLLVGPILANNSLAVADYANQAEVADLTQTSADDLTQRQSSPYVLRTGAFAGSQITFAAGQWAADEGYETAATICPDYAFGWDNCGGFSSAYLAAGGEITERLWYPPGTADLSTYMTQLASADVDVIFTGTTGGTDAIGFLQAANDFGVLDSTPIITGAATTSAAPLEQVGDIAIGVHSVTYYAEDSDEPVNVEFREAYEAAYGVVPSVYASGAYLTAQLLDKALSNAGSEKLTGTDLIDAIKTAAPESDDLVWGDVSFDEYNGIVAPLYVNTVEKRDDGKLWNAVDKTYEDVSQFWTFDPEEWLANPTFSQSFTNQ